VRLRKYQRGFVDAGVALVDALATDAAVGTAADVVVTAGVDAAAGFTAADVAAGVATAGAGAAAASGGGMDPNNPGSYGASSSTGPTGGGGSPWYGSTSNLFGTGLSLKDAMSVGSGLYGLYQSNQIQNLAKSAFSQSNPFGPYRDQYAKQLSGLIANPSSITSYPGYQLGFDQGNQAVQRSMAAKGFLGSGNEATALVQYGQGYAEQFLGNEEQMLAGLAGSGITPNFGAALSGYGMGNEIASQSLASLGYGLGGSNQGGSPIYIPGVGLIYAGGPPHG
jgi:hypothetical protein